MAKRNKAVQWIKDNKDVLIAIGVTTVVVGGTVWLVKTNEISRLKQTITALDDIAWEQADKILELENLCACKDDYLKSLASELLRQKNSIGGQLMAERKAFLNAAA